MRESLGSETFLSETGPVRVRQLALSANDNKEGGGYLVPPPSLTSWTRTAELRGRTSYRARLSRHLRRQWRRYEVVAISSER